MTTPYERLKQLGLELPRPTTPLANYVPFVMANGFLYLSGQGPRRSDGSLSTGKVGATVSTEQAYLDAQLTGLNLLATAHHALGDLGRIRRVVKLLGMVNAVPDYTDHPKVINGCSDLFVNVLGEAGRHARSAVGMGSLPGMMSVEIEAILQVDG
ncbi:MAG: RidA family protein [Betaproteobacteria bacterium]|nr:RidA family protein [Rubrivivax sp.]